MNERLFNIVVSLIPIFCAVITGFIVPYIKTKIDSEKLKDINRWVNYGVKAAEIIFSGEKMGTDKKKFVVSFTTDLLNKKKIVISEEQLNVLVESAVKEMNK